LNSGGEKTESGQAGRNKSDVSKERARTYKKSGKGLQRPLKHEGSNQKGGKRREEGGREAVSGRGEEPCFRQREKKKWKTRIGNDKKREK